ncbi:MAG: TIGR04282 family arsenosugar biosynthesis glycosyltransferase [Betaproteobacteria bacterium]
MRIGIAVLARAPVAGAAKTRLSPLLGAAGAARLQARLLEATLAKAVALPDARVTLWVAGDAAHPSVVAAAQHHGVTVLPQQGADLGARMAHAAAHALAAPGVAAALVIGTDCPALRTAHLEQAAAALARHPVVLVPAEDGGYVLLGLRAPQPALFEGVAWGGPQVLAATRQRIAAAGLRHVELPALPDLDTPADYQDALARGWIVAA